VAVEVRTYVFPFGPGGGFPFRPKEGFGGYRFYPGSVGKAAVSGIVRLELCPFLVYGSGGIGKYKRIIPGGPDDPLRGKTTDHLSVTAQNIFLGTGDRLKSLRFRQTTEFPETILRTGEDMKITGNGF
jgi:hypothetical protein